MCNGTCTSTRNTCIHLLLNAPGDEYCPSSNPRSGWSPPKVAADAIIQFNSIQFNSIQFNAWLAGCHPSHFWDAAGWVWGCGGSTHTVQSLAGVLIYDLCFPFVHWKCTQRLVFERPMGSCANNPLSMCRPEVHGLKTMTSRHRDKMHQNTCMFSVLRGHQPWL